MQVLNFHLFPYPPLPDELYAKSAWVTLSNTHYDEKVGHATNNPRLQDEGTDEKIGGKVQKKVGQVEKVLED